MSATPGRFGRSEGKTSSAVSTPTSTAGTEEFDYVVVGAGSAGAVVAARLSEDPGVSVALVEAGGSDRAPVFRVPSLWPYQQVTNSDWDYDTEPEPGLLGRRLSLSRGKVLGGSSSMNGMIFLRGAKEDYDGWSSQGLRGWSFDDVLPVFRDMEASSRGESEYHGATGPITVSDPAYPEEAVASAWIDAAIAAGYPLNDDLNGPTQLGPGRFPLTVRNGERVSSSTAYLEPAAGRANLTVLTYTQARRVLIESGRAVGVEVEHLGVARTLRARREVVVSGGAYNSPHLLMLSGIGHADHLREHDVEPLVDLPVGDHLQDHPGTGIYFYSETPRADESSALGEAGGFFKTQPELAVPDTESMIYPHYNGPLNSYRDREGGSFSITVQVLRPASRGTVRLRSPYPTAHPRITHNHFTDPADLRVLIDALRLNMEIARQPQLQKIVTRPRLLPDSESDRDLTDYVRRYASGFWHPTSSCAMGAVVDERLRVIGVDGLRVADASVMPTIVGANPNATVLMIGERAAAFLKADA